MTSLIRAFSFFFTAAVTHLAAGTTPLYLFIDSSLIASKSGLEFRLHSPVPQEIVFRFDAPWEGPQSAYASVLNDGEKLRLYYRGGGDSTREVTCVAYSRDGLKFERPPLGLYDYEGSRSNNIVFVPQGRKAYGESHNMTPFLDTSPSEPPERRWKALALGHHVRPDGEEVRAGVALISADGLRWKSMSDTAVLTEGGGYDSQNIAFRDSVHGYYRAYYREGRNGFRSVRLTTSTDFLHWSKPVWAEFGELSEHFYTNAITPYHRNPGLYLGFPMRFVPQRKKIGADALEIDGVSDAIFLAGRDGVNFSRLFREAFIRPGLDPHNWGNAHGNNTPAWGLVQRTPEEISIYWTEHYGEVPRVRRGSLRTDGFISINASATTGELVTKPFAWTGGDLVINYSTSAIGSVRVEVQDERGAPIPGYELCNEIYGDEIERKVLWKGRSMSLLANRRVVLRILMSDADLYSFCGL